MKHDPLRDGDDAVLRLTERGQFGLYSVVGVGHDAYEISQQTRYTGGEIYLHAMAWWKLAVVIACLLATANLSSAVTRLPSKKQESGERHAT